MKKMTIWAPFVLATSIAYFFALSNAGIVFEDDFETDNGRWSVANDHLTTSEFDESFQTSNAHGGFSVARLFIPANSSTDDHGGMYAKTSGEDVLLSDLIYYSFYLKVATPIVNGTQDTSIVVGWSVHDENGTDSDVLVRGAGYGKNIFGGHDEVAGVQWWPGNINDQIKSHVVASEEWVHVEFARMFLPSTLNPELNITSRVTVNAVNTPPSSWGTVLSDENYGLRDMVMSLQHRKLSQDTEVWIDDLVVRDEFHAPGVGVVGSALVNEQGSLQFTGIEWPTTSGSGFGLVIRLYLDGEYVPWGPLIHNVDFPPEEITFVSGENVCGMDLSGLSVTWAHSHFGDPESFWASIPSFESEPLAVTVDTSLCEPESDGPDFVSIFAFVGVIALFSGVFYAVRETTGGGADAASEPLLKSES